MRSRNVRLWQILGVALALMLMVGASLHLQTSEITTAVLNESRRDADYVANSLALQIGNVARGGGDPYQAIARDSQLQLALQAAPNYTPTVLYAAFTDPQDIVTVHSDSTRVGSALADQGGLPNPRGLDVWLFLADLFQGRETYEVATPLSAGDQPFGNVRVGLSSAFIRNEIRPVLRRGLFLALAQLAIGVSAAYLLTRAFFGPLRELRRGIKALSEGDYSYRVPTQEIDEFADMAQALNALGEQFSRQGQAAKALEQLGDGVLLVSADRELTHINETAAAALGMEDSVRGSSIQSLWSEDHPLRKLVDDVMGGADRQSVRIEDARDATLLAVGHRVHEADDNSGVLIEVKDLDTLGEVQAVMDYQAALSRLGEMAAGVAHEIRNPLNAITLNLERIRLSTDLPPAEVRRSVESTREEIGRLDRAVTGFLKVARLKGLSMRTIDSKDLVHRVVDLHSPEATMAGLQLKLNVDPDTPAISGDPEVLRQSLTNLVKNAIQAVPSRTDEVTVSCERDGSHAVFRVSDTGPGIPKDLAAGIFDLYMTTKSEGSGVGLAFVRQAVEMHRGSVSVDSDSNGTVFTIRMRAESGVKAHV